MSSSPRRGMADAWVTSLSPILAGDAHCHFAPWFRARHWLNNDDPNFDKVAWRATHAIAVEARARALRSDGWVVSIEGQNSFSWFGKTVKLSAKPDIIAIRAEERRAKVSDEKTGRRRPSDYHQVLLYMIALPFVRPDLNGYAIDGEIVYGDGIVDLAGHEATPEAYRRATKLLREIGFTMPPTKTPSVEECRWCPLAREECQEKIEDDARATGESEDF